VCHDKQAFLCQDGVYLPCVLLLSLSDVCVVLCLSPRVVASSCEGQRYLSSVCQSPLAARFIYECYLMHAEFVAEV